MLVVRLTPFTYNILIRNRSKHEYSLAYEGSYNKFDSSKVIREVSFVTFPSNFNSFLIFVYNQFMFTFFGINFFHWNIKWWNILGFLKYIFLFDDFFWLNIIVVDYLILFLIFVIHVLLFFLMWFVYIHQFN